MKISQVLERIQILKPNHYPDELLISWLNELDLQVKAEVINRYEGWENIMLDGYPDDVDLETELLVEGLHSRIYTEYIALKIDYHNGDLQRYNNSMLVFNAMYDEYKRQYHRDNLPLQNATLIMPTFERGN